MGRRRDITQLQIQCEFSSWIFSLLVGLAHFEIYTLSFYFLLPRSRTFSISSVANIFFSGDRFGVFELLKDGPQSRRQKSLLSACMEAQGKNRKPWGSINYHLQRLNRGRR
ncbi:hypothetical protein MTR67_029277 [Solanum verrucosum]|uniref:Uncharacterized protein n=1 Tax=Solanum verrucosum TaxID=315347 RepID=A0AAF0R3Z0_SOLVR|nr:hypothetical protein MTR67_029277 [Solanum verrucosum]